MNFTTASFQAIVRIFTPFSTNAKGSWCLTLSFRIIRQLFYGVQVSCLMVKLDEDFLHHFQPMPMAAGV